MAEQGAGANLVDSDAGPPVSNEAGSAGSDSWSGLTRWEKLSFGLAHQTVALLLAVLGLEGLYRFGRAFGTIEWLINFKRRRRVRRALEEVMEAPSARPRRRYTREHFAQTRCDKLFYLVFDRLPRETALACLSFPGQEIAEKALSHGRGIYAALSHHGPLHVTSMLFALRGYKLAGVRDRREGAIRRYIQGLYDRKYPEFGRMRVLYADSFPRDIYRCLQDGFVLGSAMDVSRVRDSRQRHHEVTMFGKTQIILSGPLRIAMRCKSPVFQAFILPEPGFRYSLQIEELLDPSKLDESELETALEAAVRRYAANVEEYIRKAPHLLTRI